MDEKYKEEKFDEIIKPIKDKKKIKDLLYLSQSDFIKAKLEAKP